MRGLNRNRGGFTLIELMVAVAIIGVLAAIAGSQFMRYTWRTKRSEAYANLESVRKTELAYSTEFGAFVSAQASPGISLSKNKQAWQTTGDNLFYAGTAGEGFDQIGWRPEGATYHDYEVVADDAGDGPRFTAAAYGDVDGDGAVAAILYVYPDVAGNTVDCGFCGVLFSHTGPPIDAFGNDVLNSVAPIIGTADDY